MTGEWSYEFNEKTEEYEYFDDSGELILSTEEISIMFDKSCGTLLKHGNPVLVQRYYDKTCTQYRKHNFQGIIDDLVIITGKFDLEELNKIIGITGYISRFHEKLLRDKNETSSTIRQ